MYGTRPRHGGVGGIDGGGGGGEFEEQGKVDSVMVQVSSGEFDVCEAPRLERGQTRALLGLGDRCDSARLLRVWTWIGRNAKGPNGWFIGQSLTGRSRASTAEQEVDRR